MRADLKKRIESCQNLPSLPAVALKILELCRSEDVDLREVARTLEKDPALAAKVLRVANSPLYGLRSQITTLTHALLLLGINSVRALALSFSLVRSLSEVEGKGFDHRRYWKRSLLSGIAARALADTKGWHNQEELFLASLLQDIGMLVLNQMTPRDYGAIIDEAGGDHLRLAELEGAAFGSDHADVSAWLLHNWNLPGVLASSVAGSHRPSATLDEPLRRFVCGVAVSSAMADVWAGPDPSVASQRAFVLARDLLAFDQETFESTLGDVAAAVPETAALFEIDLGDAAAIGELLDRAREALVEISLESARSARESREEAETLQSRTRELEEISRRDGLTGLFNRAHFDIALPEMFGDGSAAFSLIFCDLDRFKSINDTYGHASGDAVLSAVGQVLSEGRRSGDLVARYGGEEFVVLLPETDYVGAGAVARRICRAIAEKPFQIDDGIDVRVTVSCGYATHSAATPYASASKLLDAADRALYQAKDEGGDRALAAPEAAAELVAT